MNNNIIAVYILTPYSISFLIEKGVGMILECLEVSPDASESGHGLVFLYERRAK